MRKDVTSVRGSYGIDKARGIADNTWNAGKQVETGRQKDGDNQTQKRDTDIVTACSAGGVGPRGPEEIRIVQDCSSSGGGMTAQCLHRSGALILSPPCYPFKRHRWARPALRDTPIATRRRPHTEEWALCDVLRRILADVETRRFVLCCTAA